MSNEWIRACRVSDVPENSGACVLLGDRQIAVFNLRRAGKWYATENRCPHWGEEALSRGLIAEHQGELSVACPFHKRNFSLETGACSSEDVGSIRVFPVRVDGDEVYIQLGG